jgi:hypothetical protein
VNLIGFPLFLLLGLGLLAAPLAAAIYLSVRLNRRRQA